MEPCDHGHAPSGGLADDALRAALAEAERRCVLAHERLTPSRRRVLELLLRAGQPVKAYDLIAAFGENGAAAKPPTVYRALDFLSRKGFAHRIESLNAYIACRFSSRAHAAAFLICNCCGATREVEPFTAERVRAAADHAGYVLDSVTVEGHGLCPACATRRERAPAPRSFQPHA